MYLDSADYTLEGNNALLNDETVDMIKKAGTYTLAYKIGGVSKKTVTVKVEDYIVAISADVNAGETFNYGADFDTDKITVTATFKSGTTVELDSDYYTFSGYSKADAATQNLTIAVTKLSDNFNGNITCTLAIDVEVTEQAVVDKFDVVDNIKKMLRVYTENTEIEEGDTVGEAYKAAYLEFINYYNDIEAELEKVTENDYDLAYNAAVEAIKLNNSLHYMAVSISRTVTHGDSHLMIYFKIGEVELVNDNTYVNANRLLTLINDTDGAHSYDGGGSTWASSGAYGIHHLTPHLKYDKHDTIIIKAGFKPTANGAATEEDFAFRYIGGEWILMDGIYKVTYDIAYLADRGGVITDSGSGAFEEGTNRTFTFTAKEGYVIKDVIVDSVSKGALTTYTFEDLMSDHTLELVTEKIGGETNNDTNNKSNKTLILVSITVAVLAAGGAVAFFVIKKKRG